MKDDYKTECMPGATQFWGRPMGHAQFIENAIMPAQFDIPCLW
jgi:hypothetical protein